jgi:hypothetical protein
MLRLNDPQWFRGLKIESPSSTTAARISRTVEPASELAEDRGADVDHHGEHQDLHAAGPTLPSTFSTRKAGRAEETEARSRPRTLRPTGSCETLNVLVTCGLISLAAGGRCAVTLGRPAAFAIVR